MGHSWGIDGAYMGHRWGIDGAPQMTFSRYKQNTKGMQPPRKKEAKKERKPFEFEFCLNLRAVT